MLFIRGIQIKKPLLFLILIMAVFKLNHKQRRKVIIFLSSLGLASFLWFFYTLSGTYRYPATLIVSWADVPYHLALETTRKDTLQVQLEGKGWQLLSSKILKNEQAAQISLKNLKNLTYIDLKTRIAEINRQLHPGQKISKFQTDTIYFKLAQVQSKKVPVRLRYKLQLEPFYGFAQAPSIKPEFITISGPAEELQNLRFMETELLHKAGINTNFTEKLSIKKPASQKLNLSPQEVTVQVRVAQYTEKEVYLDIQVRNKPENVKLKLFPSKVKLTVSTPLTNYAALGSTAFEAYVDFNLWQTKKLSQLPIKLARIPNFTKILKIEPQTLDFIIQP